MLSGTAAMSCRAEECVLEGKLERGRWVWLFVGKHGDFMGVPGICVP